MYNCPRFKQDTMPTHSKFLLLFVAGCWMLAGCAGASSSPASPETPPAALTAPAAAPSSTPIALPSPEHNPTPALATAASSEPPATLEAARPELEMPLYSMKVVFDYARRQLEVVERLEYMNSTGSSLLELPLVIEANRYAGAYRLDQISGQDGAALPGSSYRLQDNLLWVALPQALAPYEKITLELSYFLQIPLIAEPSDTLRPMVFGYTERQVNIVDWYAYVPPYRSGGWLLHPVGFFGEHQALEPANYEVDIQLVEAGYPATGGTDIILAAGSLPERVGKHWVYTLENSRSFAWSASHQYLVYSEMVGATQVDSYAFPYYEASGQAVLKYTAEALALYNELFGAYPRSSLSVVEGDFFDGMEYDGLYFLSRGFYNLYDGTPGGYLTAIAVHETAHQWWYGLVGNDQALEPWLDEALCTYSEHIFYENRYPEWLDQWWYFRVNYYQPGGYINRSIYDYNGFTPYRDATYLHGAQFLDALRERIGDQAFFQALHSYAERNAGQIATAQDFFDAVADASSVDWSDLKKTYFLEP